MAYDNATTPMYDEYRQAVAQKIVKENSLGAQRGEIAGTMPVNRQPHFSTTCTDIASILRDTPVCALTDMGFVEMIVRRIRNATLQEITQAISSEMM